MTNLFRQSFAKETRRLKATKMPAKAWAAGKWARSEIFAPALPTAVLAVLANEAIGGASFLRDRLVSPTVPKSKKKKKKRSA